MSYQKKTLFPGDATRLIRTETCHHTLAAMPMKFSEYTENMFVDVLNKNDPKLW